MSLTHYLPPHHFIYILRANRPYNYACIFLAIQRIIFKLTLSKMLVDYSGNNQSGKSYKRDILFHLQFLDPEGLLRLKVITLT